MYMITSIEERDRTKVRMFYGREDAVKAKIAEEFNDYIAGSSFYKTKIDMNNAIGFLPKDIELIEIQ